MTKIAIDGPAGAGKSTISKKVAKELGDNGRILLRKSGTEPLVRVMVEATTDELCEQKVDEVIQAVKDSGHLIKVK